MLELHKYIGGLSNRKDNPPIFKIKTNTYARLLHRVSDKLGYHKRIKTHILRHSCANWLRDNGFDLIEIKEYLGHEDISTTQRYQQTSDKKLRLKFDKLVGG